MIDTTEMKRCAAAATALRPDWNYASTFAYLQSCQAHREYRDLAVALIACALDPTSDYPKRLEATDASRFWRAALVAQDGDTRPAPPRFLPGVDDQARYPADVAHRGAAMCRDAMGDADGADALRVEYELGQLRSRLKALAPQLSDAQRDELAKALGLTTAPTDRQDTA